MVLVALVAVALCGLGLRACSGDLRQRALLEIGEVTAVVDGARAGTVVVHTRRHGVQDAWLVSDDDDVTARAEPGAEAAGGPRAEACAGDACYRVAGDALRVEGSGEGGRGYTTEWEVRGAAYAALVRAYPELGDPAEHLTSRSVVVHAVPGGHVVFVADGRDGLLRRDPGGAWHRLGAPDAGEGCCFYVPPPALATDPPRFDPSPYIVGVVAATVLTAGVVAAVRRRRWAALPAVAVLAAMAGYLTHLAAHLPDVGMFPGLMYGVPMMLLFLAGGAWLAVWCSAPARQRAATG